jgi:hypothetical protein
MQDLDSPAAQSKKRLPIAIMLGLLTFVVTPVTSVIVAAPLFLLGKISGDVSPTVVVANLLRLREITGYLAAYFLLIAVFALIGDLATAAISWLINRSRKLAFITFVSAFLFQGMLVAVVVPLTTKKSQKDVEAVIARERSYQKMAGVGDVRYEVQEPYTDAEIRNSRPEFGRLHRKLRIVVPVSVSQAGAFRVTARYSWSRAGEWGSTRMKEEMKTLDVGEHQFEMEFVADGSFGFWSPKYVGGTAEIKLYYVQSEQEVHDALSADPSIDEKQLALLSEERRKLLKSAGIDNQTDKTKPTLNRYIERKEVNF